MRRAFLLFIVVISIGNLAYCQDVSELYNKVLPSVVKIRATDSSEDLSRGYIVTEEGLGSGVLIEGNRILTASHVVQTATRLMVEFSNGEKLPATVISSVPAADVALLELLRNPKNSKPAILADSDQV